MSLYEILNILDIKYVEIEHVPVYTVKEAAKIKEKIDGIGCKNLFLTDKKGKYYIYMLKDNKKADIKYLSKRINSAHLSFANIEELKNLLNLNIGSVTPLGIVDDKENLVTILIDKELKDKKLLMHPNINSKTISLEYIDFIKFIEYEKHSYYII